MLRSSPVNLFLRLNTSLWELRNTRSRAFCIGLFVVVQTMQFTDDYFFRNRPELELRRRLTGEKPPSIGGDSSLSTKKEPIGRCGMRLFSG